MIYCRCCLGIQLEEATVPIERIAISRKVLKHWRAARQSTHERVLRSVLDFAARDLPQTAGDRRRLQQQLQQFDYVSGLGVFPARFTRRPIARHRLRRLSRAEICQLHARLRGLLDTLKPIGGSSGKIPYEMLPARVQICVASDSRRVWSVDVAEWPDTFWLSIRSLLSRFGERVIRCQNPRCQHVFLRMRRQAFCSPACSQRVRSRDWYERHRDEVLKRRKQAYEDHIQAQHPGAKIRVSHREMRRARHGRAQGKTANPPRTR